MTSTSLEAPPDGGSMIRLTEILHRSVKLRQRRFEMLPLRGQGAPFTEPHARNPSDSLPPSELADLISSMSVIGLLEPVLAEEIVVDGKAPTIRLVTGGAPTARDALGRHQPARTTLTSQPCPPWSAPAP